MFCWRKQCNNAMTQLGLEPRPLIISHWVSHPGLRVVNELSGILITTMSTGGMIIAIVIMIMIMMMSLKSTITKITEMIQYFFRWYDVLRLTSDFIGIHSSNYYSIVPGWLPSFCCGTMKLKKEFLKIRWGQFIILNNALWVNMFS